MTKKSPLIPLIKSERTVEDIQNSLFPEICKLSLHSENLQLITDYHVESFPISKFNKQNNKKTKVDVLFFKGDPDNLDPSYEYVMLGNVYEINKTNDFKNIKVSFSGLLMEMKAFIDVHDMEEVGIGMRIID